MKYLLSLIPITLGIIYYNSKALSDQLYQILLTNIKIKDINIIPDKEPNVNLVPMSKVIDGTDCLSSLFMLPNYDTLPTYEKNVQKNMLIKLRTLLSNIFDRFLSNKKILDSELSKYFIGNYSQILKNTNITPPLNDFSNVSITSGPFIHFLQYDKCQQKYYISFRHWTKYPLKKNTLDYNIRMEYQQIDNKLVPVEQKNVKALNSAMFTYSTIITHLSICHLLIGQTVSTYIINTMSSNNPLKIFLWNFIYGNLDVNYSSIPILLYKHTGIIISAFPFKNDNILHKFMNDEILSFNYDIFDPENDKVYNQLKIDQIETPTMDDALYIYRILSAAVSQVIDLAMITHKDELLEFLKKIYNFNEGNSFFYGKSLQKIITTFIYSSSVIHEMVGNMTYNYVTDYNYPSTAYDGYTSEKVYNILIRVLIATNIKGRGIFYKKHYELFNNSALIKINNDMLHKLSLYENTILPKNKPDRLYPSCLESAVQA